MPDTTVDYPVVRITGYGEAAKGGDVHVAQSGKTVSGDVAGRIVAALESRDWATLGNLYRRSRRFTLSVGYGAGRGPGAFDLVAAYGPAILGAIELPSAAYRNMSVVDAFKLVGVDFDRTKKPSALVAKLARLVELDGRMLKSIAASAGITPTALSHLLNGERRSPSIDTVAAILAALGRKWADLDEA